MQQLVLLLAVADSYCVWVRCFTLHIFLNVNILLFEYNIYIYI